MALRTTTEIHINLQKSIDALSTTKVLKVGWFEDSRYKDGTHVAEVAAIHEYGAPHKGIPPRPFMGPAIAQNKTNWLEIVRKGAKKALKGETNILDVLDAVGAKARGDVAKAIRAVTSPRLAESTIRGRLRRYKSKGNKKKINPKTLEKPLVDTGNMLESVTYSVEEES